MKKTFEYDLTKYSPDAPVRTEEFLTADGVKTLTTDANDGAVLLQDEVDGDSLNPVTGAAVAAAIEAGGGGGSSLEAGQGIRIQNDKISVANDGNTLVLTEASITTEDNPYNTSSRNFYLDPVSLTNTCDIVFGGLAYTATLQATADQAGHTVRLALCGNGGTEYVFSKFNFRDLNADDIVLVEGSNTGIFSTATVVPSGRKWSDVFDFTGVNLEYFFGGDVSIYFVAWDDSTGSVVGNPWDAISLSSESGKQFIIYTDAVQTSLKVKNPLPDSSGATQGDVLKIGSSGPEWGAAGGGGGAGAYMVDFTNFSNWTSSDKATYSAGIAAAVAAGQPVIGKVSPVNGSTLYTDYSYVYLEESFFADTTNYIFTFTVPYWKFDPSTSPYHWWGIRRVTWETSQGMEDVLMQLATGMPS